MQKRAIAVQDISCVGRCSLTVVLPILSAAGINTSIIPTALLSTHTGEFVGYTHLDLSNQLSPITTHLNTLGIHFDSFYSGYLASSAQVEEIIHMIDQLCDSHTHVFVDPVFADHGRMYSLMPLDMPKHMKRLCSHARTIVPNITEASLLLDQPYPGDQLSKEIVTDFCQKLCDLGPENVVITDVTLHPGETGIAIFTRGMDSPIFLFRKHYDGMFHGTGDTFASFLLGSLLQGKSLETSARIALDLIHECIRLALEGGEPLRYGVPFELVLPKFWSVLHSD
ncbi:MAG: pyridoxamine kinase [Clostridiales bacterium]|nr:pyridoxamine kinase [Clostridiales bacterium]